MCNERSRKHLLARAMGVVITILLIQVAQAQDAADTPARWWGGFGLGYGYLRAEPGPAPSGAGGVWLEAQLGVPIGDHWLTGFELGGLGIEISNSNYDSGNTYSSVYGQGITHELVIVQYAPQLHRGWFAGAGAGGLLYDNRALERRTLNQRSGNGITGLCRVGYEWTAGRRLHLDVDLSYEHGDIRLNAPLSGTFGVSMLAVDLHVAYH